MATDIATLELRVDSSQTQSANTSLQKMGQTGEDIMARLTAGTSRWNLGMVKLVQQQQELAAAMARTQAAAQALDPYMARLGAGTSSWTVAMQRLADQQREAATQSATLQSRIQNMTALMATANRSTVDWSGSLHRWREAQAAATGATGQAGVSMGRFQNAIANLGLSAVGVQGPMQKIVETVAMLGAGGAVVTGVLAGLAAVSVAFRVLTRESRETETAARAAITALAEAQSTAIATALQQLDVLARRADDLQRRYDGFWGGFRAVGDLWRQWYTGVSPVQKETTALANATGQALSQLQQLRAEQAEAAAATDRQTEAVDRQIARLHDMQDALAALNKTFDAWLAKQQQASGLFTISSVLGRTSGAGALPQADLAAMDRIANDLTDQTLRLVTPSEDIAEAWGDTARAAFGAAQAMGGMSDQSVLLLHNAVAAAEAFETLAQAEKITAGDLFGAIGSAAGLITSIAGLFGGGPSASEIESDRIRKENNTVLRELNRTIGELGSTITGTEAVETQRATAAILDRIAGQPGGLSGGLRDVVIAQGLGAAGINKQTLKDLADAYGITIDFQGTLDAFRQSVLALNEAVKKNEIAQFAETFTGQMQAVERAFGVFNTTDPTEKLKELLKVAGDVLYGIHGGTIGVGSPAIERAMRGLDVGTVAGRNQLLTNLQTLFTQMRQGQLTPADLGGLTGQEFLDALGNMIELIREAEEAAKANTDALKATAEMLRGFSDSLRLGPLTTLSPVQQLVEARRQYDEVIEQAKAGDLAAAARVPALAQQLLEASRAVNASGPAYAAEFARVLFDSNVLAALFEDQADIGMQQLAAQQSTAANTAQTVTELQALVAQQAASSQVMSAQLAALHAEAAETTRQVKLLAESAAL